jgi:hypothetical protein
MVEQQVVLLVLVNKLVEVVVEPELLDQMLQVTLQLVQEEQVQQIQFQDHQ